MRYAIAWIFGAVCWAFIGVNMPLAEMQDIVKMYLFVCLGLFVASCSADKKIHPMGALEVLASIVIMFHSEQIMNHEIPTGDSMFRAYFGLLAILWLIRGIKNLFPSDPPPLPNP